MSATPPRVVPLNPPGTGPASSIDPAEVAKFEAMAADWWDPDGKFRPLHRLNPCRLSYVVDQIAAEFGRDPGADAPFAGLRLLDVGCGGGLLSEPMARLGAGVIGIDAAERNIPVARLHAEPPQEFVQDGSVIVRRPDHRAEAPRVVQAQLPSVGQQIKVVVRPARR